MNHESLQIHTETVVFFVCDGRQLLDEMNVVLSSLILCCIVTKW